MTWIPLLLATQSPSLRILVLKNLLKRRDDDTEVQELLQIREKDPLSSNLLSSQSVDGSWNDSDILGSSPGGRLQATSQALTRLGYLGFPKNHSAIVKGVEYIFSKQGEDGSWPLPKKWAKDSLEEGYSMIPLQTAIPLRGLAMCGYATDNRAEKAFDWLLDQLLEDGAWPTGVAGKVYGYVAGYRRLPHSRWGCRSNTTASLICLAHHPTRRTSNEAQRALDLLLGRETREKQDIGFDVARIIGVETQRGFITYYAKHDLALILDLCWRIGANKNDERVEELVNFINEHRGQYGLWNYQPHHEASRWVTYDISHSLSQLDDSTDWMSMEPRTPFKAYLSKPKRF
jgi:hypothetical protein